MTIQLPVFNEKYVAAALLRSVAALRYPRDRLQLQVLDDSTDETVAVKLHAVAHLLESSLYLAVALATAVAVPLALTTGVPWWLAVNPLLLGLFLVMVPIYYPAVRRLPTASARPVRGAQPAAGLQRPRPGPTDSPR